MPASVINATVNGLNATGGNTAGLELQVSGTTAVTIDSSGNWVLTNPLPIVSGGTGSNTGAFSGANVTNINASNISSGTLAVAQGGTGANTLTAEAVIVGNTTSAVKFVAPGTSANVLTSNGTSWVSQAPASSGGFDAGTVMLFGQTSAPTGWTKDTTNYNNSALRIVTGAASTGGSVDFTTAFVSNRAVTISSLTGSAGATTLTTPQIPSHSHSFPTWRGSSGPIAAGAAQRVYGSYSQSTDGAGGGGSHTHPLTVTGGSGTVDLAVKYVDVIRATKN